MRRNHSVLQNLELWFSNSESPTTISKKSEKDTFSIRKIFFYGCSVSKRMEFHPVDHLICTITDNRKVTIEEIVNLTKENKEIVINLINHGIAIKVIKEIRENSNTSYTLTPFGKEQLEIMNLKIIEGWKKINNAVETKDIDVFVKMVKENEIWIKYLKYAKIISVEDADFIIDTYKEITKPKQKKKMKNLELSRIQTDVQIERTRILTEQQWEFDDQNHEITTDYNNYVDINYDNNY